MLNAVSNQLQRNLETLQTDLANPSRIPERIAKQTEDFLQEAGNIFSETPVGLKEPAYTVVAECKDYEIRDYEAYTVASTNMEATTNPAEQGVAFNTLASYIFGANDEERVMEMTTPVTTTMAGEMRFYVPDSAPNPLKRDAGQTVYDQSKIRIERIPAARLAVRRFPGFATAGEIARQKEALLAALALDKDKVELDVPHGQTVGHVVFQYNPPYTLPVLRRNEIAVPVVLPTDEETVLIDDSWEVANGSA
jgi:SOUL heme-binding protein